MTSFLNNMVLRIVKGSKITKEDYDVNPTLISQQIDKFKVIGTTPPTEPNVPIGEVGDVIRATNNLYVHNGTEWRQYNSQVIAPPLVFVFIEFVSESVGNLTFSTENEPSSDIQYFKVYDVTNELEVGAQVFSGEGTYSINGLPSGTYNIRAYNGDDILIKTTFPEFEDVSI